MKEIKFRALWTDGYCEPKWVYGYLTERDRNILIDPGGEEGAFIIITKHENSVGQYTGLKDKNGVEIYEGDIIHFTVFDHNGADTQYKGVVKFAYGKWQIWKSEGNEYYGPDGAFDLDWVIYQDDEIEVIGNVVDNRELLEGPHE